MTISADTFHGDLAGFVDYVSSFYDEARPDALHPFATADEIRRAVIHYGDIVPGYEGDSTDRERVRDLIVWAREAVTA